jgi:hypothetical protein
MKDIVNLKHFALTDTKFRTNCRNVLEKNGCLLLNHFLRPQAVELIRKKAILNQHLAYYCVQEHNVYLAPKDANYSIDHPRNRNLTSSKGCITDDQISSESILRILYDSVEFRDFLCAVLDEDALHEFADPLSSINIHYASEGQELAWHFDNSSFAITLLLQQSKMGGDFQYVRGLRYTTSGDLNFKGVRQVLNGAREPKNLRIDPGTLVLFRGRESIHRVTPVKGEQTRILAVLAYNSQPGIELSESARMTFFGRLGNEQ